jgi:serine/threonine protein kinase
MPDEETRIYQPSQIPIGTLLLGTYEIEKFLNSGGMAWTYLALHRELNTKHVIKVIKPGFEVEGIDVLELFKREAQTLRSIRHDAIVSYEGFQRDGRFGLCLVMEYVEGPSLKQLLQERPLTADEVWRFRNRLADGLAAVHAKGIYHRDLAPDNIILPEGNVAEAKLIDFGIAKRRDPSTGTILGSIYAGKISYVAPEQFGLFGGEIGPYSDIYSFGLILAGAITGKPLDMGNSMETAYQARLKVPDLTAVPAEFREQLTAMLQPNPANRPQDTAELFRRWPYKDKSKKSSKDKTSFSGYKIWLLGIAGVVILAVSIFTAIHGYKKSSDSAIAGIETGVTVGNSGNPIPDQSTGLEVGYLNIQSSPEAALVLLKDKSFIGITPIKTDLPSGKYTLVFRKNGYGEEEAQVEVQPGKELPITVELPKKDTRNKS